MSEKTASKSKLDKSDSDAGASKANGESGKSDGGKPARESVGGAKEVHYGYFSNVRTAEYRDGWDAIWGQGKAAGRSLPPRPKGIPAGGRQPRSGLTSISTICQTIFAPVSPK